MNSEEEVLRKVGEALGGDPALRDAFTHGAAAASVTVESFGIEALAGVERAELDRRAAWLDARMGTGQAAGL